MSQELHVLLSSSRLPDVIRWQGAIDELGLGVKLDEGTAVGTGFVGATLGVKRAGFEFHLGKAGELMRAYPGLRGMFPERDLAATFRFGPDAIEVASAMAAMAGFVQCGDGVWFDPNDGVCWDLDAAVGQARRAAAKVRK